MKTKRIIQKHALALLFKEMAAKYGYIREVFSVKTNRIIMPGKF